MLCEACADALSTTVGKRPVCFCDHLLCESCVSDDGSCPLCNMKTDLAGDERVSHVFLKQVSKVQELDAKTAKYPCDNHGESEVKFICYEHKAALCADCAWDHRDHEASVKKYSSAEVRADLLHAFGVLDNHINQCQELRKTDIDKIARGNVFGLLTSFKEFVDRTTEDEHLTFGVQNEASGCNSALPEKQSRKRKRGTSDIDSAILNASEVSRILTTFGQKKPGLKLLYRASRDGDSARQFHAKCDNKGPTLVVVSAKGKKFGGFTTSSWISSIVPAHGTWNPGDKRSFLFYLEPDFVLRCVDGSQCGTLSGSSWGPIFGGGPALDILSGCLINTNSYCRPSQDYPTTDENHLKCIKHLGSFQVTNYEVFSVTVI